MKMKLNHKNVSNSLNINTFLFIKTKIQWNSTCICYIRIAVCAHFTVFEFSVSICVSVIERVPGDMRY